MISVDEEKLQRILLVLGSEEGVRNILLSFLLLFSFWLLKRYFHKRIDSNTDIPPDQKFGLKSRSRAYLQICVVVLLLLLWFSHLQPFFISLVAVAAAIVLALKELIMCFTGGILMRSNSAFTEGDRVDVDGVRGFVIRRNLLVTKLLEIGPEKNSQQLTGRVVTLPNSVMLTKNVVNESYFHGYSISSFSFKPLDPLEPEKSEEKLLSVACEICLPYLQDAKDYITSFCHREGIVIPNIEPRVKYLLNDNGELSLMLKLPVETKRLSYIEQRVVRSYLGVREERVVIDGDSYVGTKSK